MSRTHRAWRVATSTLLSLGVLIGIGVGPAAAASCARGTACLWTDSNYNPGIGGYKYSVSATYGDLYGTVMDNSASSGWANGASCAAIRFFVDTSSGLGGTDYLFVLNSQYLVGANYRDPYFSNGAGLNPNGTSGGFAAVNWNDKISSWHFTAC